MVKGPCSEINCRLQLEECTLVAAAKYEWSTLCLVHSIRLRPRFTHVRNIPLQLLRCISSQVAGPQGSLVMMIHSLSGISVEESERLAFGQGIVFILLSCLIWARDIGAKIDYADVVQKFHFEHLSSWGTRVKLHSSTFVLQELICSHGSNTSRERNTNIRGDYGTGKNQRDLRGIEMVKGRSCEINWNLQLDECTVWAGAKYERSTLCLVHSTRCRPGLTHLGNIPLQLVRWISGQVAGPQVSLVMMVDSLSGISVEENERFAFGHGIVFTVLSC